jgi:CRP-like cAMP-binding protein
VQDQNGSSTLQPLADKLCYRLELSASDRSAILALPFTLRRTEPHQYMVRERDRTAHSCVMLSGYAIRSKIVSNGQRQIVAIHMKGETVDLQNSLLDVADHSVQMLTQGQVAFIPREAIIALTLERPKIGQAMWKDTLVDGSIFREWITNVGRRDARTRIAHLLCEFALRLKHAGLGKNEQYELPMTQEQLADATGLTSVHVNRTIRSLEAEGLINRPSPRSIIISDWRQLAETGDFDSNYLHFEEDDPVFC